MAEATITSKGQITVPLVVRQALAVSAGDRVSFLQIAPGRFEFFAATTDAKQLQGMFGTPSKVVTIDQMNQAVAKAAAGK
jgi:antitoxin PrlF